MTAHGPSDAPAEAQAGFVLPSVLALLIVVCALLATAVLSVRSGTALARARAGILRMQGYADGIGRLIAYDLAVQRTYRARGFGLPEDGSAVACPLGGRTRAIVAIQDQGLLIDLNTTPRPALEEAFRALRIPDQTALRLAAEIVDYRDPDDVPEPNGGAEAPQYKAMQRDAGPRNAPFVSPDEIDRLPSVTEAIAATLKPHLTVYNESGQFDASRLRGPLRGAIRTEQAGQPPVPSPRQYFSIAVVVEEEGLRAGRSAIFSMGGTRTGTSFLTWQPRVAALPTPPGAHPACGTIAAALIAR